MNKEPLPAQGPVDVNVSSMNPDAWGPAPVLSNAMTDGEQKLADEAMRLREALYHIAHRNKTKTGMKETALRALYVDADNSLIKGATLSMIRTVPFSNNVIVM